METKPAFGTADPVPPSANASSSRVIDQSGATKPRTQEQKEADVGYEAKQTATKTGPTPENMTRTSDGLMATRDSVEDVWGPRTPYYGIGEWPARVDQTMSCEPDKWVHSACLLCSNGCGLDIGVKDGQMVGVRGRPNDRVNKGRLGPKGSHCFQVNSNKDRLTTPLIRKDGHLVPASWEDAMNMIVARSKDVIRRRTSQAIAFYTSGQLMLEEYHALAMIGKAGLHSLHMDGNTRLCTATAAAAMRESFGSDGQPGSYDDIDIASCIFLVGHNMSNTQSVLWSKILDRLAGPEPPKIIVMDPRVTETARHATIHIANRAGTNLALLNGIIHLIIKHKKYNKDFVDNHTLLFEELEKVTSTYTPEATANLTGVPAETIIDAAALISTTPMLVCTVLQGVYQSNQATASACAVNNINLLLGQIGKPGSGVLQFNGQPTAQNNRECGCNGEYPGFRNFQNPKHMQDLADVWNVDLTQIPVWHVPTHIMQIMSYIKTGSIEMLWVSGTNPLVSLPSLEDMRSVFSKPELFLVVQDIFLTETAALADVVLPAAMWGEKTGCFTNVDRTVHLANKAIDPPGLARPDLEIFIDYSRRMDMRNKEQQWLLPFNTPEEAFDHFKKCTKGRPCDYTGLSYEKLDNGGVQWPCNQEHPDGTARLYWDGKFPTSLDECESYGHDLDTGAPLSKDQYAALLKETSSRALFKACHYRASEDQPSKEFPFQLITGRTVYHFHTRTKTSRMPALQAKAPDAWVEINASDAEEFGIKEGDMVSLKSKHGSLQLPAKIGILAPKHLFVPFHFGYFDRDKRRGQAPDASSSSSSKKHRARATAANELTVKLWDPVSKQPLLKSASVQIERISEPTVVIHEKQSEAEQKKIEAKHSASIHGQPIEADVELQQFIPHYLQRANVHSLRLMELFTRLQEKYTNEEEMSHELKVMRELASIVQQKMAEQCKRYPLVDPAARKLAKSRAVQQARTDDSMHGEKLAERKHQQQKESFPSAPSESTGPESTAAVEEGFALVTTPEVVSNRAAQLGCTCSELAPLFPSRDVNGCNSGTGDMFHPASSTTDIDIELEALFPKNERAAPKAYLKLLEMNNLYGFSARLHSMIHAIRVTGLALRDDALAKAAEESGVQTERQVMWIFSKVKAFSPQTLIVPM